MFFGEMKKTFDEINFPATNPMSSAMMRRAAKLAFFKSQIGTGMPYDLKQEGRGFHPNELGGRQAIYNGDVYNFDDFGNINFGLAARAFGLTYFEAVFGAGYNQTVETRTPDWSNPLGFFDWKRDTKMIKIGFNMIAP